MRTIVFGRGQIGSYIANKLGCWSYDKDTIDFNDVTALCRLVQDEHPETIINCAPFHFNENLMKAACYGACNYLDLTEDIDSAAKVKEIFGSDYPRKVITQCGLAPGVVSIIAADLISEFDEPITVKIRVGALPLYPNNSMRYFRTWSTEGLVNEYSKKCQVLIDKQLRGRFPLTDIENIILDGKEYEAFYTSGGIGSLATTYQNIIQNMDYKSIRYPGHAKEIQWLCMSNHASNLVTYLDETIPSTTQDVVIIYVSVDGYIEGNLVNKSYFKKIYHDNETSAIRIATGDSVCAIVELLDWRSMIEGANFIKQEDIPFDDFIETGSGRIFEMWE